MLSTLTALVAAFVVIHLVLTTPPLRTVLVDRLGSTKHAGLVALTAWGTLAPLLWFYAAHRHEGPPGLGLGHLPAVHGSAIVLLSLGMMLMAGIAAPSGYLKSAAVVFGRVTREPRGAERITRHPFFAGLACFGLGHLLVAQRMAGVIVFGGALLIAVVGGLLQDRKLLAARGSSHAEYLAATSFVPLLAVLRGRQRIVAGELPWLAWAAGLGLAWGSRALHGTGFDAGWIVVLAVLVVGPTWFAIASAFSHHRARSHAAAPGNPHRPGTPESR